MIFPFKLLRLACGKPGVEARTVHSWLLFATVLVGTMASVGNAGEKSEFAVFWNSKFIVEVLHGPVAYLAESKVDADGNEKFAVKKEFEAIEDIRAFLEQESEALDVKVLNANQSFSRRIKVEVFDDTASAFIRSSIYSGNASVASYRSWDEEFAITNWRQSIEIYDTAIGRGNIAWLTYRNRDADSISKALEDATKAVSDDSEYWPVYRLLGDIYRKRGDARKAVEYYLRFVERGRGDANVKCWILHILTSVDDDNVRDLTLARELSDKWYGDKFVNAQRIIEVLFLAYDDRFEEAIALQQKLVSQAKFDGERESRGKVMEFLQARKQPRFSVKELPLH